MSCPRCGEWAVCIVKPGWRACLNCGWTRPVEWSDALWYGMERSEGTRAYEGDAQ